MKWGGAECCSGIYAAREGSRAQMSRNKAIIVESSEVLK